MIKSGDKHEYTKEITREMVDAFAEVTGDLNPVHFDEEYAKGTMFNGCIVHGMLYAGFISKVLGMDLPGKGTVYLGQELKFTYPVRVGDVITASVVVESVNDKNIAVLTTDCRNQEGKTVLQGKATVLCP